MLWKWEKRHYFSDHSNSCKVGKILHQKHESFTFELPTTKLHFLDKYNMTKNVAISKRRIFSKKAQMLNIFTFLDHLAQFCSENRNWLRCSVGFTHFINRNVDVCMYVCMYVCQPYLSRNKVLIWHLKN